MTTNDIPGNICSFAVYSVDLTRVPIYHHYHPVVAWIRRLLKLPPRITGYKNAIPDLYNAMK